MHNISEILDERTDLMGVIHRDDNFLIVESPNFSLNHCIRVINLNNDKFYRLSIFEPKYIGAEEEDFDLSKEELDYIIPIISSNWKRILENMNDQFMYDNDIKTIDESMSMPNYYELLKGEKVL